MAQHSATTRDSRSTPPGFWVIWLTVATDLVGFGIVLPLLPLFAKEFGAGRWWRPLWWPPTQPRSSPPRPFGVVCRIGSGASRCSSAP
jgi:hypothetical protein